MKREHGDGPFTAARGDAHQPPRTTQWRAQAPKPAQPAKREHGDGHPTAAQWFANKSASASASAWSFFLALLVILTRLFTNHTRTHGHLHRAQRHLRLLSPVTDPSPEPLRVRTRVDREP